MGVKTIEKTHMGTTNRRPLNRAARLIFTVLLTIYSFGTLITRCLIRNGRLIYQLYYHVVLIAH